MEGPQHLQTLSSMHYLAVAYSRAGQLDQAVTLLKETVEGRQKNLGREHPDTLESMSLLGSLHLQRGQYAEAEPLLLEAYEGFAKRQAAGSTPYDDEQVQAAMTHLVELYEKSNQPEKAANWKSKLDTNKRFNETGGHEGRVTSCVWRERSGGACDSSRDAPRYRCS